MQHQITPPSSQSQQMSAPESCTSATRPIHSRSASHPIKTVFLLTAKKAIHYQLSNPNLATQQSTTADHPSMLLPALEPPNVDSIQKSSDPLRFKSTLFSSPSNPEISVGHISRRLLEPIRPPQIPYRETGQLHNIPTRPTRSNVAHNELLVRGPFPVIVSSLAHPSSDKKRSHRRRWSTQRSKNDNPLKSNDSEPFNLSLLNQQASAPSENGRSTCDRVHLAADQHLGDDSNNISPQSPQFSDHSNTNHQSPTPCPIGNLDYNGQEPFDIDDLTTPTLKSCDRFEDDNSITPCQTFTTPSFKKLQPGLKVTPRMIYEDYQKKFNEEDLMIKFSDLKVSPRQPPTSHENTRSASAKNNFDNDYSNTAYVSNDFTASAMTLHEISLNETSQQDSADESFESFGDDQFFGPMFSSKSHTTRKRNAELIGVFPLPPATRNLSCLPSNVQRTPSPKQMGGPASSKPSTPVIPRIVMVGNEKEPARSRSSSPLVLGKPLRPNTSTKQCTSSLDCRPLNSSNEKNTPFQLQPSPYRHVEHDSIFHDGPDHLESSTRLMNMFDSFLERSPKGSGSNSSVRSSLARKSYRNLKFEESPLKKFSSFHLPETPELIIPLQDAVIRDSLGLYSHSTPFNVAHSQRSSGLAFEISKNPDSNASLAATDSSSFSARLPKLGSLLSPQECYTSLSTDSSNNFPSRRDEHASPASDSDDEPSPTPKTPFGNVFNPSNQLEPYAPTFGPLLSERSLSQKLVFKTDTYNPLEYQPLSLEVSVEDGSLHRLPKLSHSTKPRANATTDPFQGPQLKNRKSRARLMADGIIRLANKRLAKEPFNLSDSNGKLKKYLHEGDQSSSPTDEGFDSSPNKSNWTSIIEQQVDLSSSVNPGRQNTSDGKPTSGRILFEDVNRDMQDFNMLGPQQTTRSLNFSMKEMTIVRPPSKICGPSTYDICTPSQSGKTKDLTHTSSSSLDRFGMKFEQQPENLTEGTEDVPKDLQQILSPIRLYGKQQGVLETGNWKTNNLNFQSMKSQYQVSTFKSDDRPTEVKSRDAGAAMSRDRTLTEETHKKKGGRLQEEEEAEAEKEKNESLMVYKIQEEDENQIINFELNRLKKIFYNKALRSSKSKSKLSSESKPRVKLFNH